VIAKFVMQISRDLKSETHEKEHTHTKRSEIIM
jgi:hypothetical protein